MAKKTKDPFSVLVGPTPTEAQASKQFDALLSGPYSPVGAMPTKKSSSGGGTSFLGGLKNVGSTGLKVLSVPQAVLFTGIQKAGNKLSGGAVSDASWKNLGGSFYSGYKGGKGLLQGFGVKNKKALKWGGLGLDLVADPLWFAAPVKIAKNAETLGKASKVVRRNKKFKGVAPHDTRNSSVLIPDPKMGTALIVDTSGAAKSVREWAKRIEGADGNIGIRIGTKNHGITIRTPIRVKAKPIGSKKIGKFKQGAEQKLMQATRRVGGEAGRMGVISTRKALQQLGLKSDDLGRIVGAISHRPLSEQKRIIKAISDGRVAKVDFDIKKVLDQINEQMYNLRVAETKGAARSKNSYAIVQQYDAMTENLQRTIQQARRAAAQRPDSPLATKLYAEAQGQSKDLAEFFKKHQTTLTSDAPFYSPQWTRSEELGKLRDDLDAQIRKGGGVNKHFAPSAKAVTGFNNPTKARAHNDVWQRFTRDQFVKQFDDPQMGEAMAKLLEEGGVKFSKELKLLDENAKNVFDNVEMNLLETIPQRVETSFRAVARQEAMDILKTHGIEPDSDLGRFLFGTNTRMYEDLYDQAALGSVNKALGFLKGMYTTINPAHYINNFIGDYINRLINGRLNMLTSRAWIPKSEIQKLAGGDPKYLDKVYNVGGKKMTGEEIMTQAHMAGLGDGHFGGDIIHVHRFLRDGRNPFAFMARVNNRREAAQRLETWVKHLEKGDDPFTAAEKVLRVHFDYRDLTPFETKWLKNSFLFYTWLRRNMLLQAGGLVTRPGLYAAYESMERNRPHFENEPAYFADMGLMPGPLGTVIGIQNPMNDLRRQTLSMEEFRSTVLGAVNPVVRMPFELGTNTQTFTGGPIAKYEGARAPSVLGLLTGQRVRQGEGYVPGVDARLAYLFNQLGPASNTATSVSSSGNSEKDFLTDLLGRVTGVKVVQDEPEKFKRTADFLAKQEEQNAKRAAKDNNPDAGGG